MNGKEFDTYKVGTVANSCSTMHKIQEKEFTLEDFSTDQLLSPYGNHNDERDIPFVMTSDEHQYSPYGIIECITIPMLNVCRDEYNRITKRLKDDKTLTESERKHLKAKQKVMWWQMIQLLPSSYNQTRNVMMNYEVLANIYKSRKNHKLDEWRKFCRWIKTLPYQKLITGEDITMCDNCMKQYDGCKCDCTNEYEKLED